MAKHIHWEDRLVVLIVAVFTLLTISGYSIALKGTVTTVYCFDHQTGIVYEKDTFLRLEHTEMRFMTVQEFDHYCVDIP